MGVSSTPAYKRAAQKLWRERHPEKHRALNRAWKKSASGKASLAKSYHKNPDGQKQRTARYLLKYPEHTKDLQAKRRLKWLYGLSAEDREKLASSQDYRCAICGEPFMDTSHIDHDHKTGKVRGILCPFCNRGLGQFKDDSIRLRAAAVYLEERS